MSRIGKKPIPIPGKTKVAYNAAAGTVTVEGEKGKLTRTLHSGVGLDIKDNVITVTCGEKSRQSQAFQGLTRSLLAGMVTGVSQGFERSLEINGIGYKADVKGNALTLNLGYSHPIDFKLPVGITARMEKNVLKLFGCDKEELGQTAASIKSLRPPEPYKGKGVKYLEERIQRKAGKTGAK